MSGFEFDASDFLSHLDTNERNVMKAAKTSVEDSLDDLARIATDIAPIDDSDLRKSANKETEITDKGIEGKLTFSAIEKRGYRRFNYAYWTHEMDYNLGEQSSMAPGTDGYHVGNKYVERPLKGESERYIGDWAKDISKVMDSR